NELCPPDYKDASAQAAREDTQWLIDAVRALPDNDGRVLPVITPRFIPNCSDAALTAMGELAQTSGAHIQTHCSESDWVHQRVSERMGRNDARALADFGLLTRRSTLAHANFLADDDTALIRERGSALAHCPLS